MRTDLSMLQGHDRRPQPPPYQQTDPFVPSTHAPLENEPLLAQYRTTSIYHNPHRPAKDQCSRKFVWFTALFIIGVLAGCTIDRFYNYTLYETLWRRWAQEEEHRASIRALWAVEVEQHEVDVIKWKEEKAVMDAERKKWEEEQERQRVRLIWEDLHPGRCLRYATREYKATLSNVGTGVDALRECSNKALSFRGKELLPTFCDLEGPCGRVTGHWAIDFDEAGCSPWWDKLTDKGCDRAMHKRRYEAHLVNVQNKGDWEVLCKTTPTTIDGIPYDGAMFCIDSIWGVFGNWFVDDTNCS